MGFLRHLAPVLLTVAPNFQIQMPCPELHHARNAGLYFVAYKLTLLGFTAAFPRTASRDGIDLFATNADGTRSVPLLVRSSASARRTQAGDDFMVHFPLTRRTLAGVAEKALFCFVDLRCLQPASSPDVYVIPARRLKEEYTGLYIGRYSRVRHLRSLASVAPYRDNWQPLTESLLRFDSPPEPAFTPDHAPREIAV